MAEIAEKQPELAERQKELLTELFYVALSFGEFELKGHEKNPSKSPSPYYFNLRVPENGGKLNALQVVSIAEEMARVFWEKNASCDFIAGIPNAGSPFARELSKMVFRPLLRLGKKQEEESRRVDGIIGGEFSPGQKIILVDDLITGGSSTEEAIAVVEKSGLTVASVITFLDRCGGGAVVLRRKGYRIFSAFSVYDFWLHCLNSKLITWEMYVELVSCCRGWK